MSVSKNQSKIRRRKSPLSFSEQAPADSTVLVASNSKKQIQRSDIINNTTIPNLPVKPSSPTISSNYDTMPLAKRRIQQRQKQQLFSARPLIAARARITIDSPYDTWEEDDDEDEDKPAKANITSAQKTKRCRWYSTDNIQMDTVEENNHADSSFNIRKVEVLSNSKSLTQVTTINTIASTLRRPSTASAFSVSIVSNSFSTATLNISNKKNRGKDKVVNSKEELPFAKPISQIRKGKNLEKIGKMASIKSTRFSKRFQTRKSVEHSAGTSFEKRDCAVNDDMTVIKSKEKFNSLNNNNRQAKENEYMTNEILHKQSFQNVNSPKSAPLSPTNFALKNDALKKCSINNINTSNGFDASSSLLKLEFVNGSREDKKNACVELTNISTGLEAPCSSVNAINPGAVVIIRNEEGNEPATSEPLDIIDDESSVSKKQQLVSNNSANFPIVVNLENGDLHDYSNNQQQMPSNVLLLKKLCSKFYRRNRVAAIQQEIVPTENTAEHTENTAADSAETTDATFEFASKLNARWRTIIFDTSENYFYYWLAIISTAYVYNLLVVIARSVFMELSDGYLWILWLSLDCFADSIYLADMFIRSRTGFLEQGLLIRDGRKIFALYLQSRQFKIDLTSILPLDYVVFVVSRQQMAFLRLNRLLRRERLQKFMEQTETRSALPNAFRVGVVVWYIAIIIHWNACFYFLISERIGLGSDGWVYGFRNEQSLPKGISDTLTRRYIYSFYWSTLILTTIGEVPAPQMNIEYAFVTVDLMCGVLIFATIVGNVGSMISNMSAARTEFQSRIDNIKQYMELRKVSKQLEVRVIKWFDYLWANKQNLADQQVLKVLPNKLQAEIAMHVHFETLRKVRIFQDCEAGLLAELVLKLQLQVFSPMDYVCRKGDIGREMYIVKRGMIQVVSDDGGKVFATLSEGAVFGELSILNIAGSKNGNRRTANVRSVGYTDLFVLNKLDLWVALKEYPEARKILIQKGRELLRKDNLLDENAPDDNKSAEEIADDLQSSVRILQTRMARLIAEHTNTETKLKERIAYLEGRLKKYGNVLRRATSTEYDGDIQVSPILQNHAALT